MNITDIKKTFKGGLERVFKSDEVYTLLLVVLVGAASFGLGRVSVEPPVRETAVAQTASLEQSRTSGALQESKVTKEAEVKEKEETSPEDAEVLTPGKYVASKSGSKYHLPRCGGAKQIKEENKVWFETKEEAEAAGYEPASNCKGI